jgi:hypothetical protein
MGWAKAIQTLSRGFVISQIFFKTLPKGFASFRFF